MKTGPKSVVVKVDGSFWASPVLVGNRLIATNMEGEVFVVDAEKGTTIGKHALGDQALAAPAVRDDIAVWRTAIRSSR